MVGTVRSFITDGEGKYGTNALSERGESRVGDAPIGKLFLNLHGKSVAPTTNVPSSHLVLTGTAVIVSVLYFARAILLSVALATVLAFVLSPAVGLPRRLGLGRVPATLLVVLLLFSVLGAAAWVVANQVMTVAGDIPRYADTIKAKIAALRRLGKGTALDRARGALTEVVNEVEKGAQPPAGRAPLSVVVKPSPAPLTGRLPVLLEPLATAGLVLLLSTVMPRWSRPSTRLVAAASHATSRCRCAGRRASARR